METELLQMSAFLCQMKNGEGFAVLLDVGLRPKTIWPSFFCLSTSLKLLLVIFNS
jgi:hypothetical protein